jgi:hypothetical protein
MYRQVHEEQRTHWITILGRKSEIDAARTSRGVGAVEPGNHGRARSTEREREFSSGCRVLERHGSEYLNL